MKKSFSALIIILVSVFSVNAFAKPEKGWHKGFYFLVGAGFLNVDKDTDVNTNQAFGSNIIPAYGLTFGSNWWDFLALELSMRYGTEVANSQREHAFNIDLDLKYSILLDALTRGETFRLLPYVKAGGGLFAAAVPTGTKRFGVFGPTVALGAGLELLIKNLWYVGVDFTEDLAFLQDKTSSSGKKILNGGFDPQHSLFGYVGVHF